MLTNTGFGLTILSISADQMTLTKHRNAEPPKEIILRRSLAIFSPNFTVFLSEIYRLFVVIREPGSVNLRATPPSITSHLKNV